MKKSNYGLKSYELNKFKKMILEMHKGFPNSFYFDKIEEVVRTQDIRNNLVESNVLTTSLCMIDDEDQEGYALGVNGLILANNYLTERQTLKMINLTKYIASLTIAMLLLVSLQVALIIFN